MAETTAPTVRTYGNWRRPTSPGLLGLGTIGTALLFVSMFIVLLTMMTGGVVAALVVALVCGSCLAVLVFKDADGRSLLSRAGNRLGWWSTKSQGSHLYRSGPLGCTEWGSFQLPGIAAASKLSEHEDAYGRKFALLQVPASRTYAVVLATEPDGASLVDQDQVDHWVADWGHWLANLSSEPGLEAAGVTIETAPESGARLRREVELHLDPQAPIFAQEMLREVVETYPAGSSSVKAYVTLTFAAATRRGGPARTPEEMARDLSSRLPGLVADLQATGAGAARPMPARELCELVRVAYDPAVATVLDEALALGQETDLLWSDVGPASTEATWDCYRHDSAWSVSWAMTQAPRGNVQSGVLARLLAPHRDIARKRVTLLYGMIDPGRAAGLVEADLRAAEFRASSTKRPQARDSLAVRSAAASAGEEASGAGLVNFSILVTATVLDPAKLPEARAAVDNLSAASRLRIRPAYGSQDSAFVMALPLGLIPKKHSQVPSEFRDSL